MTFMRVSSALRISNPSFEVMTDSKIFSPVETVPGLRILASMRAIIDLTKSGLASSAFPLGVPRVYTNCNFLTGNSHNSFQGLISDAFVEFGVLSEFY